MTRPAAIATPTTLDLSGLAIGDESETVTIPIDRGNEPGGFDPSTELLDPTTGELVPLTDPDELIEAYQRINSRLGILGAAKDAIRKALADLTEGDKKTRRVQGKRHKAEIKFPDDKWSQPKLKEAWNAFENLPALRDQVLKISEIGVKIVEFRKLKETSGDKSVELYRDMIAAANEGASGLPTVKVEG